MPFVSRLSWLLGVLAALLALSAAGAAARPIELSAKPVPLNPDDPAQTRVGALCYLGGLELNADEPGFGGFSGLVASPDGRRLLAISDHGHRLTARVLRDASGRLVGLADTDLARLLDVDGKPIGGGHKRRDSEAAGRDRDGGLLVSFERQSRLYRYPPGQDPAVAPPVRLPLPSAVSGLPFNGGLEAIAPLPGGALLLVSEDYRNAADDMLGWLLRDGAAQKLAYAPTGLFKPTDLAVLPNGDVLALERRFTLIGGVAARLQRIPRAAIRPGARLAGEELARLERPLTIDNFEALATARDRDGATLVFVLSDDNFNGFLQRTLLLLFTLSG